MEDNNPKTTEPKTDGMGTTFTFVTEKSKRQIRSHAMRESWKQRHRKCGTTSQRRRAPAIAPKPDASPLMDLEGSDDNDVTPLGKLTVAQAPEQDQEPSWQVVERPSPPGYIAVFEQPLSGTLDPFNITQLPRLDQILLYHWVNDYAPRAFGRPTDPTFNPMRDLYVPVDLSHKASVHAVLAHSAAHVAYLRQERMSPQALVHKMAAISLVNEYLGDPVKSISDQCFSAVLRLLTFERYWGTEATWKLHRKGLAQMVKKRGGLPSFPENWRLEMKIQLVSLLSPPRWNDPVFAIGDQVDDFERPHSDFVNFFVDIQTNTTNIRHSYPAIARATIWLQSSPQGVNGFDRLMCLFYIAIVLKDSNRTRFDLSWLNDSLQMTEDVWTSSIEGMRWLLLQGMGRGPEGLSTIERTLKLEQVARMMKENSWSRMESQLLNMILGGSPESSSGAFDDQLIS
ncbi:hypothetical protein BP6252_11792 [Coleophoma cylindrospora]|uniref:Uncharacterized protein n=1 Tax=Coleophoma cylindrospora TaxID=1849047 RepID=A0A3D8QKQ2_9HELO|nr:hypothetical protein BP6252_11792 [Coleophoma cylindrospora]